MPKLTETEKRVLIQIGTGLSNQEAADVLGVSRRTIDFHLANIFHTFNVKNRIAALREAVRHQQIPSPF